jgi:hypothetical protein
MKLVEFFDSEFLSQEFLCQDETFVVHFLLWNNKPAKIVFDGVVGFCVFSNNALAGLRYEVSPSEFFHNALSSLYETIPEQHAYKCYDIIDVDDMPFIKVVAKGYNFLT